MVTFLLIHVYVYESLPPCYKKLKNDNFTKILDATTKEVEFQMAFSSLNAVLYVS